MLNDFKETPHMAIGHDHLLTIDEGELEDLLIAAYERGANWVQENPISFGAGYLSKAARDFADKTITEKFK